MSVHIDPQQLSALYVRWALRALRRGHPQLLCPACQIDILTNPDRMVSHDVAGSAVTLFCNCAGPFNIWIFTEEYLDDCFNSS